jgi:hypothetical protein
VPHGPYCLCRPCANHRRREQRSAERAARRPVQSAATAAKIAELRKQGFTLTEISEASQLSIGVVHKASRDGAWLRPETAERILELEVTSSENLSADDSA